MENCMAYYNKYLSNALRRRQQRKQNYKDLYLTELLRFKKEISFPHSIKWKSMFDFILDSYQLTREKKLDTYTYFLFLFYHSSETKSVFLFRDEHHALSAFALSGSKRQCSAVMIALNSLAAVSTS